MWPSGYGPNRIQRLGFKSLPFPLIWAHKLNSLKLGFFRIGDYFIRLLGELNEIMDTLLLTITTRTQEAVLALA
jgi:hypothetical protein